MKCNLLIDGNYFLYRLVFPLQREKSLFAYLWDGLEKSFDKLKREYHWNKIYFISDGEKNWKKNFYPEYKGKRKKDSNIDWEFVFNTYNDFRESLKQMPNVAVMYDEEIEGDDWIGWICDMRNQKEESNFIFSGDSDLFQKVNTSRYPLYINLIYNSDLKKENLYLPYSYNFFKEELKDKKKDIFEGGSDYVEFEEFLKKMEQRTNIKYIDSEEETFCKLVSGDNKDNIPSAFYVYTDKYNKDGTQKVRGIGDKGARKIYQIFKEKYNYEFIDFFDKQFLSYLIEEIAQYKKTDNKSFIKDNLKRNYKLTLINEKIYPQNLLKKIKYEIDQGK